MAVPAEYLIKLLKSLKPEKPPTQEELLTEVTVQAIAFGRYQMKAMNKISNPERALGPFSVHGYFNNENPCRTERSSHPSQPYTEVEQGCQAGVGVYLMPGRDAGRMQSEAVWMHSKSLSSLQMSSLLTRRINSSRTVPESQRSSAAWTCRQQRVKTPDGLPVQIYACGRPVKHLPDLHDYKFRYAPLVSGPDALMVSLELTGMDRGSAQAVLGLSLASLRWQLRSGAAQRTIHPGHGPERPDHPAGNSHGHRDARSGPVAKPPAIASSLEEVCPPCSARRPPRAPTITLHSSTGLFEARWQ